MGGLRIYILEDVLRPFHEKSIQLRKRDRSSQRYVTPYKGSNTFS